MFVSNRIAPQPIRFLGNSPRHVSPSPSEKDMENQRDQALLKIEANEAKIAELRAANQSSKQAKGLSRLKAILASAFTSSEQKQAVETQIAELKRSPSIVARKEEKKALKQQNQALNELYF